MPELGYADARYLRAQVGLPGNRKPDKAIQGGRKLRQRLPIIMPVQLKIEDTRQPILSDADKTLRDKVPGSPGMSRFLQVGIGAPQAVDVTDQ